MANPFGQSASTGIHQKRRSGHPKRSTGEAYSSLAKHGHQGS
jgi:hypothetical protein